VASLHQKVLLWGTGATPSKTPVYKDLSETRCLCAFFRFVVYFTLYIFSFYSVSPVKTSQRQAKDKPRKLGVSREGEVPHFLYYEVLSQTIAACIPLFDSSFEEI
jgi:hypothetical protein